MKKCLLMIIVGFICSLSWNVLQARVTPQQRAQLRAERVAQALKLTQQEQQQVLEIFSQEEKSLQQIVNQPDVSIRQIKKEIQNLRTQSNQQLQKIVGYARFAKYQDWVNYNQKQLALRYKVTQEQQGIDIQGQEESENLKKNRHK